MPRSILRVDLELEIAEVVSLRRFGTGLHIEIGFVFFVGKSWQAQHAR